MEHFALWSGNKTLSPELDAPRDTGPVGLMSCAVDADNGQAICDSVSTLDGEPGSVLPLFFCLLVAAFPADGGGIDQHFRTSQGHESRGFGVPLIPTDQYAEFSDRGLNGFKTEVARGEVKFFVIGRVVGDVHFAVFPGDGAVFFKHHCGIVIKSRGAFFKKGCY